MPVEFAESNPGSGGVKFAVDNITEGANTLSVPYVKLMSGTDTSNAVIPGDVANGLDVDVTRVQGTVNTNITNSSIEVTASIPLPVDVTGSVPITIKDGNVGSGVVKTAFVNATAAGNTVVVAAVSGKKIRVLGYRLQAHGSVNVKFVDTNSTPVDLTMTWKFQDREGAVATAPVGGFEFETVASRGVQVNLSAAVQVGVQVIYVEV